MTGGAGFIGSHLVDELVKMGYEVSVIDDLSTGEVENLQCHLDGEVKFFKGDIRDGRLVDELVGGVDAVIHLAAISSVSFSVENPVLTNDVNVNGTLNLLNACVNAGVQRFIFISSCAVYGEPCYLPVNEKHPVKPLSPYAASKVAAEEHCEVFRKAYGLDTVVLRLFNVYGSRQRREDTYSGVITRFAANLVYGKPLLIYGDGSQTRDFIHVGDVVEAVRLVLESGDVAGETFNVGSGKPTSINELAKLLTEGSGGGVEMVYEKRRIGDLEQSYADIGKAEKALGYKPRLALERGLRSLMFEFKEKNKRML